MNFTMISELNARYPNQFLDGRYRQEVVFYKNKFYTFGGGKEKKINLIVTKIVRP